MNIKSAGFIGLGLIGGSIAKAIKKYHPDVKIYAHARSEATLISAHKAGITENDSFIPLEKFAEMDVLFLCSPVLVNIEYLEMLSDKLKAGHTLITDVGSVKGGIEAKAKELGLLDKFIGGHPMTGSEKDGFVASDPLLLENAYYILTKNDAIDPDIFLAFEDFIKSLGASVLVCDSASHDFATAAISHLPHIISASLVNLVSENDTEDELLKTIAAGGFKDITRISSSSPVMWQNICVENKDEILKLIGLYDDILLDIKRRIESSDEEMLLSFFSNAKNYRDNLPVRGNGALPGTFDLYTELSDEAGQIANIASILAIEDISIKNIGIVHNREFEQGVLNIETYDLDSKNSAIKVLKDHGYNVYSKG